MIKTYSIIYFNITKQNEFTYRTFDKEDFMYTLKLMFSNHDKYAVIDVETSILPKMFF